MTAKQLFDIVSPLLQLIAGVISASIELFTGLSVALFIIDGIKAKRQERKRKGGITAMFVISMVFQALILLLGIYACVVFFMFLTGKAWTT